MAEPLYPLLFEPHLAERPWGGDALHTVLDKSLPVGKKIGESWEIYSDNVIANGALAGRTLRDVLREYGDQIGAHVGDEFPVLIKFLDAREWLSVQVHPNDQQAKTMENQPRGKTECWYILEADEGAQIAYGAAQSLSADDYRAAIAAGTVRDTLAYVNVAAGDFIYVPAGTPHAIGPGIVLYELQQASDTTYRVYDWDRAGVDGKPRELHIEKALAVMDLQPRTDVVQNQQRGKPDMRGNWVIELVRSPYFALDRVRVPAPEAVYNTSGKCHLISVINGTIAINDVEVPKGSSVLIPASLGRYTLYNIFNEDTTDDTIPGSADVLRAWPI